MQRFERMFRGGGGRPRLWLGATLVALAFAAVIAGCGSDSDSGTATGTADATATDATGAELGGPPIKIGFFNPDQGVQAKPGPNQGMEAAVARINETGINGSPIEIVDCSTAQTPESDIACANEFVQKEVVAAFDGSDFAVGAALPILHSAKIPLVGFTSFAPEAELDPESYYFLAGQSVTAASWFKAFQLQGFKKITFVSSDNPGSHGFFESVLVPMAAADGIELSPAYYDPAAPNFTAMAASVAATDPELGGSIGFTNEEECTAFVKALRDTGFDKPIFVGACSQFIGELGAEAAGVQMSSASWLPVMKEFAPAEVQEQLTEAEADMGEVASLDEVSIFGWNTYSALRTLAEVLATVEGEVTNKSVTAALESVKDMPTVMGPTITCNPRVWPQTSTCADATLVGEVTEEGTVEPIEGGFIAVAPPKGK